MTVESADICERCLARHEQPDWNVRSEPCADRISFLELLKARPSFGEAYIDIAYVDGSSERLKRNVFELRPNIELTMDKAVAYCSAALMMNNSKLVAPHVVVRWNVK